MIKLTRLNGEEFVVNADLIRFVERRPDTYVTLTSHDRFIVREPVEEVVKRALAWTRAVRARGAAGGVSREW
jgi:flagellar protein FlbD